MLFLKKYASIKDFLYRFTIIKIGKLHIRIHKIVNSDLTSLYHNHPFNYISIILKGGYIESSINGNSITRKTYNSLSILYRNKNKYHRIDNVKIPTYTLFIAWGNYKWNAINMTESKYSNGIYKRNINDKELWSKYENGIWFIGSTNLEKAKNETRHSIHQINNIL